MGTTILNRQKVEDMSKAMNEACVEVVLDHLLNTFIDNAIDDQLNVDYVVEQLQHFRQAEHWQMAFEQDLEDHLEDFREALYVPNNG